MLKRFFALAVATALFAAQVAVAEPDAPTSNLMKSSPSMLDWGTLRMEIEASKAVQEAGIHVAVQFDPEADKFIIYGRNYGIASKDRPSAEALCHIFFSDVRKAAWVDVITGRPKSLGSSLFSTYFLPKIPLTKTVGSPLKNIAPIIDKKIFLNGIFRYQPDTNANERVICDGSLLGVSFSRRFQ